MHESYAVDVGLFGGPTEAELAEAARCAEQWRAAAPCPDHGHTVLCLAFFEAM